MSMHKKQSTRRLAKATGAGLIACGLLLGGPAGAASADNAVTTAVSALGTTVNKAVVAGNLATHQAVKAGVVSANTAVKAAGHALSSALKGLLGKK
jgi:hypothetical protein